METLYRQRLNRYLTAMRNEKPDMVPVRPFVAEFTAKYAGFTCQEVTHDYNKAFIAARKCAADFDWDATVSNMVYVWTGLTQAIGLTYYGVPGIDVPPDTGFQYREPSEDNAFMKADEYDALIDDPTAFLYNTWLPRVSADIRPMDAHTSYRNNLALVKGAMAMNSYFAAYGPHVDLLRRECGTVSAIAGIFKAPFDILADKLRGYIGLTMDMVQQPEKVLMACEALMPHLYNVASTSADPAHQVPIGYWMHRGCIPFVSKGQFESHYWPTTRPIIEELWRQGHQTLFYAEGNWGHHLDSFAELPDASIVYHVDRGDVFKTHEKLGHKFCLSGGIPNFELAYGKPDQVRAIVKKVIDGVAQDGGYIVDASAIMQNDTSVENLRAMTEAAREYGIYSGVATRAADPAETVAPAANAAFAGDYGLVGLPELRVPAGACIPWSEKRKEIPIISGDADLAQCIWEEIDAMANSFIWQVLLSF